MPDDKTWTWDDLATMAGDRSPRSSAPKGVYGMDVFGLGAAELGVWARQHGEEVLADRGPTAVTQATVQSYFEYANKLIATQGDPAGVAAGRELHRGPRRQPFATNKAAFHLQFHTQIAAFVAASGTELKLLRLPAQAVG